MNCKVQKLFTKYALIEKSGITYIVTKHFLNDSTIEWYVGRKDHRTPHIKSPPFKRPEEVIKWFKNMEVNQ